MKNPKPQIKQYILDCIDLSGYGIDQTSLTPSEQIAKIYEIFKSEYVCPFNKGRNESHLFAEWMQGLPSCFNVDFAYPVILGIGRSWGYDLDSKFKEYRFLESWYARIATNFFEMLN